MVDENLTPEEQRSFRFFVKAFEDVVAPRLGGVENRLDRVENKLSGVENRLDKVEGRLNGVESRLDRMENTLDRVAEKVTDHGHQIEKLKQTQAIA